MKFNIHTFTNHSIHPLVKHTLIIVHNFIHKQWYYLHLHLHLPLSLIYVNWLCEEEIHSWLGIL